MLSEPSKQLAEASMARASTRLGTPQGLGEHCHRSSSTMESNGDVGLLDDSPSGAWLAANPMKSYGTAKSAAPPLPWGLPASPPTLEETHRRHGTCGHTARDGSILEGRCADTIHD